MSRRLVRSSIAKKAIMNFIMLKGRPQSERGDVTCVVKYIPESNLPQRFGNSYLQTQLLGYNLHCWNRLMHFLEASIHRLSKISTYVWDRHEIYGDSKELETCSRMRGGDSVVNFA